MIDGLLVVPLARIPDERGMVMHMLRADAPHFKGFGEIYFSMIYPGVVKGWHIHSRMTLNYAALTGTIKLVLYDERRESPSRGQTQEIFLGRDNYCLIQVPPGIWNGFKGLGLSPALVANCADTPHDPDEIERLDPFDNHIPYDWGLKHG